MSLRPQRIGNQATAKRSIWRLSNGGTLLMVTVYHAEIPIKRSLMIIAADGTQVEVNMNSEDFKSFAKQLSQEIEWQQGKAL